MVSRILIINDAQDMLNLFYDILDREEFDLELSNYAFEDQDTIERLGPHLVILDFLTEDRAKRWQLLQKLKMHRSTASIPLIICTAALNDVREQEDYLRKKGVQVVFKPFEADDLVQTVYQTLRSTNYAS